MPPRRFSGKFLVVIRVLALALLILAMIWAGGFLLESSTAWLRGGKVGGDGLLYRCAICGLIATLFVAVFHLKQESLRLPAPHREEFLARVRPILTELGYVPTGDAQFRPAARSLLFGSGIRIAFADDTATLHGPRVYLEVLRRRLRVQGHVEHAERKRPVAPTERLFRSVELGLRVEPGQWDEVNKRVIEVLRQAGADVVCHVDILAQHEAGISERVVEGEVQQWLRQEAVDVELRKQPLSNPSFTLIGDARAVG